MFYIIVSVEASAVDGSSKMQNSSKWIPSSIESKEKALIKEGESPPFVVLPDETPPSVDP